MGGRKLIPLMMSLSLLTSCGGEGRPGAEELALRCREELRDMTRWSCRGEVAADYGDWTFSCVLDLSWDALEGCTVTVEEPEEVSGLRAELSPAGTRLGYEDFSLETGPLTGEGLSPLEAVPTLITLSREGYMAAWDLSGETLTITFREGEGIPGEGLEGNLTLDAATHLPTGGELYWNGTRVITSALKDFQRKIGEN